jgi:DDE superfamily endonuclease
MCDAAGVILAFLPPYSPDFNPIEEMFHVIKCWLRKNQQIAMDFPDFGDFLDLAVRANSNGEFARGHFRNAKIEVD